MRRMPTEAAIGIVTTGGRESLPSPLVPLVVPSSYVEKGAIFATPDGGGYRTNAKSPTLVGLASKLRVGLSSQQPIYGLAKLPADCQ
jgi:hypothetical protein